MSYETIPVKRRIWKLVKSGLGIVVLFKGVPWVKAAGWPWEAQAAVALLAGLLISTDMMKQTVKAAIGLFKDFKNGKGGEL